LAKRKKPRQTATFRDIGNVRRDVWCVFNFERVRRLVREGASEKACASTYPTALRIFARNSSANPAGESGSTKRILFCRKSRCAFLRKKAQRGTYGDFVKRSSASGRDDAFVAAPLVYLPRDYS
jgi:hypothetical protein